MLISLIHPSRGRALKARATLDFWLSQASGTIPIEHILSIDNSDDQLPIYKQLFSSSPNSCGIANDNTSVVDATNQGAKVAKGDILIYLSDDFKCPKDWDLRLVEEFDMDLAMLLKVDDCLQKFHVGVLTIPIMNRKLYNKLGYFWHPEYKSMFVDEHLYWICKNNSWLHFAPDLKFPHEHPCNGLAENDETYKRSAANWDQGKALFAKHKAEGFLL